MSPTAAARSPGPKTATKTAPAPKHGGFRLPLGNHPGNTGGKKGRSGRPPVKKFAEFLAELRDDPEGLRKTLEVVAQSPESRNLGHVLKLVRDYDPDAPERKLAVSVEVMGVIAMPIVTAPAPPSSPMETAQRVFRPVARGAKLQALADQLPEPAL